MTSNKIKIGPGPDYRMYAGQRLYHHQASITIKLNDAIPYALSLSSASMVELAKTLKEKLLVIDWTAQCKPSWSTIDDLIGLFLTTRGETTIAYRRNKILTDQQARALNVVFSKEFK